MKTLILLAVGLFAFGPVRVAAASDPIYPGAESVEYKDASGWTFTVAAYGWLAGLKGNVGAGGRTAHVDASIRDVLSNFDIGVMGLAEARYERFGVFTDFNYVRLSASSDTPFGALASSTDLLFDPTSNPKNVAIGELRHFDTALGQQFGVCLRATVSNRQGKSIGTVVYVVIFARNKIADRRRALPADECDKDKYQPFS